MRAPFAGEHRVQPKLEPVQVEYIRGGVGELLLRKFRRCPIRTLLLLGKLNAEKFRCQIFQSMPIGIGAGEFRGNFGAVDRCRHHTEIVAENGHVEAGEMKNLNNARICQKCR